MHPSTDISASMSGGVVRTNAGPSDRPTDVGATSVVLSATATSPRPFTRSSPLIVPVVRGTNDNSVIRHDQGARDHVRDARPTTQTDLCTHLWISLWATP